MNDICVDIVNVALSHVTLLFSFTTEELLPVSLKYEHSKPQSNEEAVNEAFLSITHLSRESQKETKPDSAQHFSKLVFSIRKLNTEAMQTLWQKVHNEEDGKIR